jgi:glycosyltransferase involved in cell wall biosynthesis
MRILIDARFWGLEHAGLGRYTVNLINQIKKIDNENLYFILLRKKYYDTLEFPGNWTKVLAEYGHYSFAEQRALPKLISDCSPDIVHFLHFNVPRFYRGKFIVTIHDLLMHKNWGKGATTRAPFTRLLKRLGYLYAFKHAVDRSCRIVVPSYFVADEIKKYYPKDGDKISVIYEGVTMPIIRAVNNFAVLRRYKIKNPYFIYTGNAYPHKNLHRIIEAIQLVNKHTDQTIELVIVSARNVFVTRLEKIVAELHAEKYVKILGFVPDQDLGNLYKQSIGFTYASLSEGFGLPGLEAMAAGTISLVSEIAVFKEVYKDRVLYFNPYDFTSIAQTMQQAIEMPLSKRKDMIKKGLAYLRRYSWEKMARETIDVYSNCVYNTPAS